MQNNYNKPFFVTKQINSLNRSELRMGLGMHRARIQTGNPGFGHSDSDNYELRNPGSSGSVHA
jgi:hypothetical protein